MHLRIHIHILLSLIILQGFIPAYSQKNKKKYTTKSIAPTKDSSTAKKSEYQINFKNLGVIPFYVNHEQLKHIQKYEDNKEYTKLLPLLEEYVSSFGIQNFYTNTTMIWKLAQLYELTGQKEKATAVYKLVLKHHRTHDITQILQHYDTLTVKDKDYYVPLQEYYDLVEYRKSVDTLRPPQSVFLNMGDLVNDKRYPDYGPTLNVQNDVLIFTKRTKVVSNTKLSLRENEELYYTKNYDGFWDEAQPFSKVINSACNEGSACMSRDGKTLYFARCKVTEFQHDCRDCLGSCDIYVSYLEDSVWSVPRNLGANVNTASWESQPTLSHTEDTLYFASDRLGGFGLADIYFTCKNEKGEWSVAKNLGPVINSRDNEVSPFYHPLFDVLYYSSKGQVLNFGDFDIYKSYRIEGKWQDPKNIGPLVNGKGCEYYFTIDSKSKDLFYAKSEETDLSNLDLYSFPLPMEAQPLATTKLKGSLRDSLTGESFKGIVSVIDLSNGIEVAPKYIRPDGTYEFDLIDKNDYLLVLQGDDFFRIEEKFHLDGDTTIDKETPSLKYNKWKFNTLEFQNGKSDILPEMESDLDKVMNFMLDHPDFRLRISGHTDSQGDPEENLILSQKRADAIKNYVVSKGSLDEGRIEAIGFGSEKPIIAEEKTPEDKRINRRVEFEILKPEKRKVETPITEEEGGK
jgi:outer membrane protein OmpA-like peptidoglycan-associated protein